MNNYDFIEYFNSFIRYLRRRGDINATFEDKRFDGNRAEGEIFAKIRIVPFDFNVYDIPNIKKYCKMAGLKIENEFRVAEDNEPYTEYHECKIYFDEDFEEINLAELL